MSTIVSLFGNHAIEITMEGPALWHGAKFVRLLTDVEAMSLIKEFEKEKLKWEEGV